MTRPVVSASAERLYALTGPLNEADPDQGYAALALCAAAADMFQGVDVIAADTPTAPGWSAVVDPDRAPAAWLPWQASLYGVQLQVGSSEQAQRDTIRDLPPQHRGTPEAMETAMLQALPAGSEVTVYERAGSAYRIVAIAYTAQLVANYAPNPRSEVTKASSDTADYTVTREASGTGGVPAFVGGWRDKHAFDGSASDSNTGFFSLTFPAAGTYVVSRYVWLPAAWTGGALRITSDANYTGATETILVAADLSLRDQWQRISTRITVAAGDLAGFFGVRTASSPSSSGTGVFYSDARQVERGTVPTDYVDGHMTGYVFTGAADASSTQRDPAVVQAAALSQKPGGLVLTYRTDPGWSYGQAEAAFATYTTAQAAYATYDPAESQLPS